MKYHEISRGPLLSFWGTGLTSLLASWTWVRGRLSGHLWEFIYPQKSSISWGASHYIDYIDYVSCNNDDTQISNIGEFIYPQSFWGASHSISSIQNG